MGAWGTDSFSNDDAQDWLAEFSTQGASAISGVFDATTVPYLEAPDGARIIAAAEAVAAAFGSPSRELPEDVRDSVMAFRAQITTSPDLRHRAIEAVDRVLADGSELKDLREESDEDASWVGSVRDLRARLAK